MTAQVDKVFTFTPVLTQDCECMSTLVQYLKPLGGIIAVAVPGFDRVDGAQGALRFRYQRPWYATALIIASYILSVGLAPLIVAIATVIYRCTNKFYWIQQGQEAIDVEEARENPLAAIRDPNVLMGMANLGAQVMGQRAQPIIDPNLIRGMMDLGAQVVREEAQPDRNWEIPLDFEFPEISDDSDDDDVLPFTSPIISSNPPNRPPTRNMPTIEERRNRGAAAVERRLGRSTT